MEVEHRRFRVTATATIRGVVPELESIEKDDFHIEQNITMVKVKNLVLNRLVNQAQDLDCNAVIGIKLDWEHINLGPLFNFLQVVAIGTAVQLK